VFATAAAVSDFPTPVDRDHLPAVAVIGEYLVPFIALTGRGSNRDTV
jgi:hypothetical protein